MRKGGLHLSDDDKGLRDSFEDLRNVERRAAPSFRRVWNAALEQSASKGPGRLPRLAIAALLLLLVAGMVLYRLPLFSPQSPPSTGVQIVTTKWNGPTDFLLDTPGRALSSTVPSFTPVPDYGRLTARQENR